MGRSNASSQRGVSVLHDTKATLHDQLCEAERLVQAGLADVERSASTAGEGAQEPGQSLPNPYGALRQLHRSREVLDWVLSPRGLSRLYKSKETSFDLFLRTWSMLRRVLVGLMGACGGAESAPVGAWQVDESFAPSRTLPAVASRMVDGVRLYGQVGSSGTCRLPGEVYDVLSDVVDVLCAGVRGSMLLLPADMALRLLDVASWSALSVDGAKGEPHGGEREKAQGSASEGERALRFVALVSELFVLQMKSGRWEPGKIKEDVLERLSWGAFSDRGGMVGDTLRIHCREILRWALLSDIDGSKKKDIACFTSWAGRAGAHPRLVSWMIEVFPSGPAAAVGVSGGLSVSDVFFGCAELYMRNRNFDGLARLLVLLKVRGTDLYRTVGKDAQAMFAQLTRVSDFLMANAGEHVVCAMKGLDHIVAVEHRGIESQIETYWSLLGMLGEEDEEALCHSLGVLYSEYNRLRRLDVLFNSIRAEDMGTPSKGGSKPWDTVVDSPVAMASVRQELARIPVGQSVQFVDQVGEWIAQCKDVLPGTLSEMACAVLDSIPIDPNNAFNVAKHVRGVLERVDKPRHASERDVLDKKSTSRRKPKPNIMMTASALAVVTKLQDAHDRCCRIDPNILPINRDVPVDLIENMQKSVSLERGGAKRGTGGANQKSLARGLVAGIVYHLKAECEVVSRAQSRVNVQNNVSNGDQGGEGESQADVTRERPSKRHKSNDQVATVALLARSLKDALTALHGILPPSSMNDLVNTDEWWFDMAMDALESSQRNALVRQLLSPNSPVQGGRALCIEHVETVIGIAPEREDPEWAGPVPIFVEDVDPAEVLAHFKLLAPSIGVRFTELEENIGIINAVHELCMAHCAYALSASQRDPSHVAQTVQGVLCQAGRSTDVSFDRVRSSVALLDMALGSSALMELDVPKVLDDASIEAAIKLGELVSNEVRACSMSSLAVIIEEEDSPLASLMAIRGLLRAERTKSEATRRVICNTLVETAREQLDQAHIEDNLLTVAALAGTYAAALRAQIVTGEMIELVPNVFQACIAASRIAFDRNLACITAAVAEYLETYTFIATSSKPRMSSAGATLLLKSVLDLLSSAPCAVGAGHLCRPNAPKEAMAIAASRFDARGESRRHILRVLCEVVAGSTRDESSAMMETALSTPSLEHAELLLFMLEDTSNGVLRELLNNQVDSIVFRLLETLDPPQESIDGRLGASEGQRQGENAKETTAREQLRAVTILRCLESISCRPARFTKLSKRVFGAIISSTQHLVTRIPLMPPGNEKDACFDGACYLVRGILRHQASVVGRYLHLVAAIVASLQGSLFMDFVTRGDAPTHLLEGLSRVLEEFSKIRAVQPYLKDAMLTHIKLFMSPVARTSLEQCLDNTMAAMVPEGRIGHAVVPLDAQKCLSPGIAAVYGAFSEDDVQDVYTCLSSRSHAGEWRLRLEDLQGLYQRHYKFSGKV